jgi:hypothetical protein
MTCIVVDISVIKIMIQIKKIIITLGRINWVSAYCSINKFYHLSYLYSVTLKFINMCNYFSGCFEWFETWFLTLTGDRKLQRDRKSLNLR